MSDDYGDQWRHEQDVLRASQAASMRKALASVAPSIEAEQAALRKYLALEPANVALLRAIAPPEPMRQAMEQVSRTIRGSWERGMPANLLELDDDDLVFAAIYASTGVGPC